MKLLLSFNTLQALQARVSIYN
uniref:Uncharacterized protein n=1 Tax=Amphimedon queenslandica TaxID=400682 RepID=A0A1X7V518_AMPQE